MNEDTVKGNLKQISAKIKQKWSRLTDDDLMQAESSVDYLYGKLEEYYGLARDEAEKGLQALGFEAEAEDPDYIASRTDREAKRGSTRGSSSRTGH